MSTTTADSLLTKKLLVLIRFILIILLFCFYFLVFVLGQWARMETFVLINLTEHKLSLRERGAGTADLWGIIGSGKSVDLN